MRIYTRRGDDGTTDLRAGGRVAKDSLAIEVNGAVDEAQAALGLARAQTAADSELDATLVGLERDLWILMAEVATSVEHRVGLVPGVTAVTSSMVAALESQIDVTTAGLDLRRGFAVPGGTPLSAALDLARTIVRRAERLAVALAPGAADADAAHVPGADGANVSFVCAYLNRLSDLCWALARATEGEHVKVRDLPPTRPAEPSVLPRADSDGGRGAEPDGGRGAEPDGDPRHKEQAER